MIFKKIMGLIFIVEEEKGEKKSGSSSEKNSLPYKHLFNWIFEHDPNAAVAGKAPETPSLPEEVSEPEDSPPEEEASAPSLRHNAAATGMYALAAMSLIIGFHAALSRPLGGFLASLPVFGAASAGFYYIGNQIRARAKKKNRTI